MHPMDNGVKTLTIIKPAEEFPTRWVPKRPNGLSIRHPEVRRARRGRLAAWARDGGRTMSGTRGQASKAETDALEQAARAERRLLRAERAAEDRLMTARARLAAAEARVARRRAAVAAAEAALRERQAARAAGPTAPS